jgi:pyruvate/2-oxoglutarate dehydrogenase complex dihydrolipoamide acyltransferase (E2) component
MTEVKLPFLGEGVAEATVSFWYKQEGETISAGEDLVEVTTEKASFAVPAPEAGVLDSVAVKDGAKIKPGEVLARLR